MCYKNCSFISFKKNNNKWLNRVIFYVVLRRIYLGIATFSMDINPMRITRQSNFKTSIVTFVLNSIKYNLLNVTQTSIKYHCED